jgi:aspartate aminotransferase-like enzyme
MTLIKKHYLLSPGPTPIPDKVLSVAAQPIIHHRSKKFSNILKQVMEDLKYVFQTRQDVFVLSSSGTGAMEAAVVNTLSPGDKVITINGGKFGHRWSDICIAYGLNVREIEVEWGEVCSPEYLANVLSSNPETKAVFSTLCETSTGTIYDIQDYAKVVAPSETILIVDGISGIGAAKCPMDKWKIDVLISGSQKSFMAPPGLSYIAFSDKAWKHVRNSTLPKYYFRANSAKESLGRKTTPWTPAISLVIQQQKALEIIREIGLNNLIEHHRILGNAARAGIKAIGLEMLSKNSGNILTAVKVPEGIDGNKLIKTMQKKYKVYIAGAQAPHTGEFFRIGHLGYSSGFDIITALSGLEMTLMELNYNFITGQSLSAAQNILKENWS